MTCIFCGKDMPLAKTIFAAHRTVYKCDSCNIIAYDYPDFDRYVVSRGVSGVSYLLPAYCLWLCGKEKPL